MRLFVTPWTAALKTSLSSTTSWSLLRLMSTESVMLSKHLILCGHLLLLGSILSSIRVFSNLSALCNMWPKYQNFNFSICPSNEYSGLISLRLVGFISLYSKELSRGFSSTTVQKHQFLVLSLPCGSAMTLIHDYCKNHSFGYMKFCHQRFCFLICCLGLS